MENRLQRYREYNRERKIKAIAFNSSKADFLFKIVPLLLHSNYPDLPGFIDNTACPCGIYHLEPRKLVDSDLFRKYFPHSSALHENTRNPFSRHPMIHSLKTIGSIGTIAQTEKSDCDYWLSIRESELGPDGFTLLYEKCQKIEDWADSKGHELHFFLMDIDQTRKNTFQSLADKESAGTALKILLKDELFRTHILVAGKMLLWWLIPPGLTREGYRIYVATLLKTRNFNPELFIDLGYMTDIPQAEIFGACLWQMNKALDSPFKSIIKFAYLEMLMTDREQLLPLFSDHLKTMVTFPEERSVSSVNLRIASIDPYLLMAREIVAFYLRNHNDEQRADLIRECLFMKTLEGMASQKKYGDSEIRLNQTKEFMRSWQLLPANPKYFSSFLEWKFKDLVDFGETAHQYLIDTYRRLRSTFASFHGNLTISEKDISILGRKLFTFYEKRPNKIDFIRSLSREAMAQQNITFQVEIVNGNSVHSALQGGKEREKNVSTSDILIGRNSNPIKLMTWLIINGILTPNTRIELSKHSLALNLHDLQDLADKIIGSFPPVNFGRISGEHLLQEEEVKQALVIVNFEKAKDVSEKNLPTAIITFTSYGEYFFQTMTTLSQLKQELQLLLTRHLVSRWNNNLEYFIPPQPSSHQIRKLLFS
ncbi:MAG: class I adenylate cyclase [Proteobacteria bacterium]|nr:class I adenylate cyclase [Pseudomonadota bacterium]MBU1686681.1 class I adenylate cyclase [Pseudomonadota bacterium]